MRLPDPLRKDWMRVDSVPLSLDLVETLSSEISCGFILAGLLIGAILVSFRFFQYGPISHLETFEKRTALAGVLAGILILGVEICSPDTLPGGAARVIALLGALITLITYLLNRGYQRRKVRVSVVEELVQAEKQYNTLAAGLGFEMKDPDSCDDNSESCDLYKKHADDEYIIHDPDSNINGLSYAVVPVSVLESQISEIGRLSEEEVKLLTAYYSLANIFKKELSEAQKALDNGKQIEDVHAKLDNSAKLSEVAYQCIGALPAESDDRMDMKAFYENRYGSNGEAGTKADEAEHSESSITTEEEQA